MRMLAVGMLPPPISGQALLFQTAIDAMRKRASVDVIDIQVQRNMAESGSLSIGKLVKFVALFTRICGVLFRRRYDLLYYCPSGPSSIGVLKDIVFLAVLRLKVRRTVYHFHGTGGTEFALGKGRLVRALYSLIVARPDLSIRCADVMPNDTMMCEARHGAIIFNGIPDPVPMAGGLSDGDPARPVFTFTGALIEQKGLFELVEICRQLKPHLPDFKLQLLGEGRAEDVEAFDRAVAAAGLEQNVQRLGVVMGAEKFALLRRTTLFFFPTFFRAETQPVAVIEAAALGVPAIVYDWRGLKTIVEDGVTGYVVPVRDTTAFADRALALLRDGRLEAFRAAARQRYEEHFTLAVFERDIARAFDDALAERRQG